MLIEEYRHGIERNSFELPCGTPDHEGESVLEATKRELREETGFAADEWHALGSSTANTARQNNRVHAFLALDARKVAEPAFDAGEVITTHLVPWEQFLADLADGRREARAPLGRATLAAGDESHRTMNRASGTSGTDTSMLTQPETTHERPKLWMLLRSLQSFHPGQQRWTPERQEFRPAWSRKH